MYARVARWEDGTADALRRAVDEISSRAESGPPEGVPSKGLLMLVDPDTGRSLAISFYETEEDRRVGDETLNRMSPTSDQAGQRVSVENYEVGIDVRI